MKISSIQSSTFKPITLTITLESSDEARALYQLGNYSYNVQNAMLSNLNKDLPYEEVLSKIYQELKAYDLAGT